MYVLLRYWTDGSDKPKVNFIKEVTYDQRDGKYNKTAGDILGEVFSLFREYGDEFELYHIDGDMVKQVKIR